MRANVPRMRNCALACLAVSLRLALACLARACFALEGVSLSAKLSECLLHGVGAIAAIAPVGIVRIVPVAGIIVCAVLPRCVVALVSGITSSGCGRRASRGGQRRLCRHL
jgi:hypothetical protein